MKALAATALALLMLPAASAGAQENELPNMPDQELFGRPSDEYALQFCVDPRDPGWTLDKAVGEAIADALLLEARPVVLDDVNETGDFIALYRYLLGECRVFLGFKMIAAGYPEWLTLTRPYYETGYVFVAPKSAPARLADIAPGTPVAATLGSSADFRFVQYNNNLPARQRWQRFPYSSDELTLEAVADGVAAAGLVWGPSFRQLRHDHPAFAELVEIDSAPISLPVMAVAGVLLGQDSFLRASIDEAIASLVADGVLGELIERSGMPGNAPRE
ncbi:hypothetical protein WH87_12895 [Devosia epidermidihirudinis]|uniref:Solute-binding protein family 3/N-terminal domain-containing protein n=1 Tax=Devosia epidermidihirudinis TaxID=1293439 RepID=A0A0F5QBN4_9HYPH|nr:transporter substrate-binding domain-containing protein [Devosia epidermidihirudinis]KKC37419.1 hypothetical protein WH87_12895 [Devosia epidermidihirudinis]